MKKASLIMIFSFIYWNCLGSAITTVDWGGRFGDQLVLYTKAKWIAYKLNIPFLYKPFLYSNQLVLHTIETPLNQGNSFEKKVTYKQELKQCDPHTLYLVNFATEIDSWDHLLRDQLFIDYLKLLIYPNFEIPALNIPPNAIKIAVHIRKGGGCDPSCLSDRELLKKEYYSDQGFPLKFLPLQYYIDEINYLASFFDQNMYIYIFTDEQDPARFVKIISQQVNNPRISYGFREKDNHHSKNVVEDFFTMSYQFDCLIRGGSHFALIADLIGNHKIVVRPIKAEWRDNILVVTKTVTVAKDEHFAFQYNIPYQNNVVSFFTT